MAYRVLNGFETYDNREYTVREAADRLGVGYEMAKKYVHEWKVIPYRLPTPRTALISGRSIIGFIENKESILQQRRADNKVHKHDMPAGTILETTEET